MVDASGYRNGLPSRIMVHVAQTVTHTEATAEAWVEGEPGVAGIVPVTGAPFACVLFLPGPGGEQQNDFRPRVVRTPTLLYNPLRDDGTPVIVDAESELLVTAPELAAWTGGQEVARWLLAGAPQPFGPPGQVIGVQATLRTVIE